MKPIKKVLCVCIGNSDRSPVMAAVLGMFLKNAGYDVQVESAGTSKTAETGQAAPFGLTAAKRLGQDISGHKRRRTTNLDLAGYDLIITASDEIAGTVIEQGADMGRIYNAQVPNPWPVQFQADYDRVTMPVILVAMNQVLIHYGDRFVRAD